MDTERAYRDQEQGYGGHLGRLPATGRLPMEAPQFVEKFRTPSGVLNIVVLLLGVVNISIIGYNFSYFKGTWRKNLFHSELNYLVSFVACFVGTAVNIIGNIVSPQPFATKTVHETVASGIYALLSAVGATVLLIQLTVYGRYFVDSYEVKVFSGILGLVEALLYAASAAYLYKSAKSLL